MPLRIWQTTKRLMVVAVQEGRLQRGVHLTEIAIFASGSGSVSPLSRDESDSSIVGLLIVCEKPITLRRCRRCRLLRCLCRLVEVFLCLDMSWFTSPANETKQSLKCSVMSSIDMIARWRAAVWKGISDFSNDTCAAFSHSAEAGIDSRACGDCEGTQYI